MKRLRRATNKRNLEKRRKFLTERIAHINKMMHHMRKILLREESVLRMNIQDAINSLVVKRRAEFRKLWNRYEKIGMTIESLQNKENKRLN